MPSNMRSAAGWSILAALTVILAWGGPTPAVAIPPAAPPRIESAIVVVDGASVHARFAALAGVMPTAADSLTRARKLRRMLDAAEADVDRRQAPVIAAAARLGIDVVSRYRTVANALLVHGTPDRIATLARVRGVVRIEPAPRMRLSLARSVPRIRADVVASQLGFDGAGSVVAVVDSGIDYTHAQLGGPGTPDAYQAAAREAETVADQWEGRPLFPTGKVIGGWDFVGPKYTHPNYCTDDLVRAGRCVNKPQPDPDPLDEHNHGTHVAGIVAGNAVAGLANGVAPGAKLVALKLYGTPPGLAVDEEVDVVLDAIEWCARVNLDLAVPGIPPPHVDVINMSLGEPFGQAGQLFDEAVSAAADVGITVVASAGNAGNRPFVLNAPSASPRVLSVASSIVGGDADIVSDFSARGPGKHGSLKPDVTAPGSGIFSAARGSGSGGSSLSGTSMASPHTAGAMALLHHRNRAQSLGLGALDLAALLMNYAEPGVSLPGGASTEPVGVTRQGAGRIDLVRAATASLVARAGDIAGINLGAASFDLPNGWREVAVDVRNLSDAPVFVLPQARFTHADDAGRGMVVMPWDEPIEIPARGTTAVPVGFVFESEIRGTGSLRDWSIKDRPSATADVMDAFELDGTITFKPVDANGRPVTDTLAPAVPFYVLPRRASAIRAAKVDAPAASAPSSPSAPSAATGNIHFDNRGYNGMIELFGVPAGSENGDPDEAGVEGEIDVAAVGARFEAPESGIPAVTFGIALHAVAPIPQATALEIYVDTDRDGRVDWRVRAGAPSMVNGSGTDDRTQLGVTPWDDPSASPAGAETILGEVPSDLHTRVRLIRVPLSALGLVAPAPFDFYVIHRGLGEDWLHTAALDMAPDDANRLGGPRYRVDPAVWRWVPDRWTAPVPVQAPADVTLVTGGGDVVSPFLALYPDNRFEPAGEQFEIIDLRSAGPRTVYLPMGRNGR